MVKSKEELLETAKVLIGENEDDTALSFLEDISDTFKDFETKTSDTTDWKTKFEENDKEWRKKYRDRFFNGGSDDGKKDENLEDIIGGKKEEPPKEETITYDDLFKEKE